MKILSNLNLIPVKNASFNAYVNPIKNSNLSPLNSDAVSFSGSVKEHMEKFKKKAQIVQELLDENDDITALETLGYNIDSDFETDEITIHGDYKPFFKYSCKNGEDRYISYEKLGIDETKLLKNVTCIEGNRYYYPFDSELNDSVKIEEELDRNDKDRDIKLAILRARNKRILKNAFEELQGGDSKKALETLGYKVIIDESGKYIIDNDYDFYSRYCDQYTPYNINENELLGNVAQIKGVASFSRHFQPNHFIEMDMSWLPRETRTKFILVNPDFMDTAQKIKNCLASGDNFSALKMMGYDVEKDETGSITINGNYAPEIYFNGYTIPCEDAEIDDTILLKNVKKITGGANFSGSNIENLQDIEIGHNLLLAGSKIKVLGDNIQVGGKLFYSYSRYNGIDSFGNLFDNYLNSTDVAYEYTNMPKEIIKYLIAQNIIQPSFKTSSDEYFNSVDGKNKEILDNISQRRNEILTPEEICSQYGVSYDLLLKLITIFGIKPYGTENLLTEKRSIGFFLLDVKDEANQQLLKSIDLRHQISNGDDIEKCADQYPENVLINEAKAKLSEKHLHMNMHSCSADLLEQLGYGTKADILDVCKTDPKDLYDISTMLIGKDRYDVSGSRMMDILDAARKNSPSNITFLELKKHLSEEEYKKVLAAVIMGKIDVITTEAIRVSYFPRYIINLFDDKNYEYFRNIDNEDFQKWLQDKKQYFDEFKTKNNERYKQLLNAQSLPKEEKKKEITSIAINEIKSAREAAKNEKLEKARATEERRKKNSLYNSLKMTIAWFLSPNTREVLKNNSNHNVSEIIKKHKETKQILEDYLSGICTKQEMLCRVKELNLTDQDEIVLLGYFKTCWEQAGVEEFSNGCKQAAEIARIYFDQGIMAIKDEAIKNKILEWQKSH